MPYGTCKTCGCTDEHACYHPDFGPCWWVDASHERCSHCVELDGDPKVQRDEPVFNQNENIFMMGL